MSRDPAAQIMKGRRYSFLALLSLPGITVALLLLVAFLVFYGTVFQVNHGLYEARRHIFNAAFVWIGGVVPFPGVKIAVILLFVNLLAAGAVRMRRSWKNSGTGLVHLGIALLFVNAGIDYLYRQESSVTLRPGETAYAAAARNVPLPFSIHLKEFAVRRDPASAAVIDYESRLHAQGAGIDRDVVVSMNRPLRFHEYTVYHSSYRSDQSGNATTLAIVKNPGWMIPYVASCMIAAGLLIHFVIVFALRFKNSHA